MHDTIKMLQEKIEQKYSVNILHILNGECMFSKFQNEQLMHEQATYIAFNEAMCWGEVNASIFSPAFVQKRVASLQTTEEEYQVIVLDALKPLLEQHFDIVVLWFGDDMFCQMNMITILAYLEQSNYSGDVLFCMALERKHEMLDDAVEIEIGSYQRLFQDVLCRREQSTVAMMPVTYQAVQMYLGYRDEKSSIVTYIKNHAGKENLLADLLTLFPEYGLGDVQYQMLIDEYS